MFFGILAEESYNLFLKKRREMKNSDLIRLLQKFDGELEVTTSDKHGTFSDISSVELQEWESEAGKHASVTLVIDGYDEDNSLLDDEDGAVFLGCDDDIDDDEFIENVNCNLMNCDKINKHEALDAKKVFNRDILGMQKKYREWYNNKYTKFEHEAMIELFGDDKPLISKTDTELKLHVYENGWQDKLDWDELNDRNELLRLLYNKLGECIKSKISEDIEKVVGDINECSCQCNCRTCNDDISRLNYSGFEKFLPDDILREIKFHLFS